MSTKGQLNYNKPMQKTKFLCTVRADILVQLMYKLYKADSKSLLLAMHIIVAIIASFAVIFLEAKNKS